MEAAFDSIRPLRSGRSSRAASGAEGGVMACYSVDQEGGPANHDGRKTFREDSLYGERLASSPAPDCLKGVVRSSSSRSHLSRSTFPS